MEQAAGDEGPGLAGPVSEVSAVGNAMLEACGRHLALLSQMICEAATSDAMAMGELCSVLSQSSAMLDARPFPFRPEKVVEAVVEIPSARASSNKAAPTETPFACEGPAATPKSYPGLMLGSDVSSDITDEAGPETIRPAISESGKWSEGDLRKLRGATKHFTGATHGHQMPHVLGRLHRTINNPRWEMFWAVLIVANVAIMIAEQEYDGMVQGNDLGIYTYYGSDEYVDKWWPNAQTFFFVSEFMFALAFTVELVFVFSSDIATAHYRQKNDSRVPFWRDPWDLLDLFIVVCADISLVQGLIDLPFSVNLLRMLRLVKLMRLIRLLRMFQAFDPMMMMTTALRGSFDAFLASFLILFLFITLPALALTTILRDFYLKEGGQNELPVKQQEQLFQYFGTYIRSMITMLELALANWPTVTRFMMEELHEGFGIFCAMFKLTVGFVVINVINGVFIKACFSVADNDDIMLARTRKRQASQYQDKMSRFFMLMDREGQGSVTRTEFRSVLRKKAISTWLEAMDLRCSDADTLFDLLAGQDGKMTVDQLIRGVAKLRGPARNIDLVRLLTMPIFADRDVAPKTPPNQVPQLSERTPERPSLSRSGTTFSRLGSHSATLGGRLL